MPQNVIRKQNIKKNIFFIQQSPMNKSYFKEKAFDNEEITDAILPIFNI